MSKELEALENIRRLLIKEYQHLPDIIEKALTPPTEEEVCEAISKYIGSKVKLNKPTKEFVYKEDEMHPLEYITETYGDGLYTLGCYLPPHLITLIGKFYEGRNE